MLMEFVHHVDDGYNAMIVTKRKAAERRQGGRPKDIS